MFITAVCDKFLINLTELSRKRRVLIGRSSEGDELSE